MTLPTWFDLEAERHDLSYRTGQKFTPEQLLQNLMREQASAAYPSIARREWTRAHAVQRS